MSRISPAGWPEEVLPVFERFITCECSTFRRDGTPITSPLTPYIGADGLTLDVATGLTYPAKAERARRHPHVALLYSEPLGSGLTNPPVVLVQGLATVRDADLQANTDRYVSLSMAKLPGTYRHEPAFVLRRQQWYFTRIWIHVTPLRILWWPSGRMEGAPERWEAPAGTSAPPSDPAPVGPNSGAWRAYPHDWRKAADYVSRRFAAPVLTVEAADGYPAAFRVKRAVPVSDGFHLELPRGLPWRAEGPACLTYHKHREEFVGEENKIFVGRLTQSDGGVLFRVEKQLPDLSFRDPRPAATLIFFYLAWKLGPRLRHETARRGQPIPRIHLPGER